MQEYLDAQFNAGTGGPNYYSGAPPTAVLGTPVSGGGGFGDLYSFLPAGWGPGGGPVNNIHRTDENIAGEPSYFREMTNAADNHDDDDEDYTSSEEEPGHFFHHQAQMPATTIEQGSGEVSFTHAVSDDDSDQEHISTNKEEIIVATDSPPGTSKPSSVPPQVANTPSVGSVEKKPTPAVVKNLPAPEAGISTMVPILTSQKVEEKITWIEDKYASSCCKCTRPFTTFRRRHHCRGCGKIFCFECSNWFLLLPKDMKYTLPQRTCHKCFRQFSSLDFTSKYEIYGPPNSPLCVLLHPATATRKAFGLLAPHLLWHHRVIMPDLPGHGSLEDEPFSIPAALKIVKDLIEEHSTEGHDKAYIIGYSLGAYVAMAFAGTYPELCRGLVVAGAGSDTPTPDTLVGISGMMHKTIPHRLLYKNLPWLLGAEVREDFMEEMLARPGCFPKSMDSVKAALNGVKWTTYLANYKGPSLFIAGELEPHSSFEIWQPVTPNGKFRIVTGASHLLYMDVRYIEEFNKYILDFTNYVETKLEKERQLEAERLKKMAWDNDIKNRPEMFKKSDWIFENAPGENSESGAARPKPPPKPKKAPTPPPADSDKDKGKDIADAIFGGLGEEKGADKGSTKPSVVDILLGNAEDTSPSSSQAPQKQSAQPAKAPSPTQPVQESEKISQPEPVQPEVVEYIPQQVEAQPPYDEASDHESDAEDNSNESIYLQHPQNVVGMYAPPFEQVTAYTNEGGDDENEDDDDEGDDDDDDESDVPEENTQQSVGYQYPHQDTGDDDEESDEYSDEEVVEQPQQVMGGWGMQAQYGYGMQTQHGYGNVMPSANPVPTDSNLSMADQMKQMYSSYTANMNAAENALQQENYDYYEDGDEDDGDEYDDGEGSD